MSNAPTSAPDDPQRLTALFANFVLSQTNLALMMLGKFPHPHTGETFHDIESARLFIDQMEMIEIRTRGNLTPEESKLLASSLTNLRLAFVEATTQPAAKAAATTPAEAPATTGGEDESRKRFTKKY